MLFFDETDAMFGHRGEVKVARDRWANLEINMRVQEDLSARAGVQLLDCRVGRASGRELGVQPICIVGVGEARYEKRREGDPVAIALEAAVAAAAHAGLPTTIDGMRVGLPIRVAFETIESDIALQVFRPAR